MLVGGVVRPFSMVQFHSRYFKITVHATPRYSEDISGSLSGVTVLFCTCQIHFNDKRNCVETMEGLSVAANSKLFETSLQLVC
jgi:hypothetical protein